MKVVVFLLLLAFLAPTAYSSCAPFGMRIQLGKYFSADQDYKHQITIMFNTDQECTQASLYYKLQSREEFSQASRTKLEQLDMTHDLSDEGSYSTYIHTFILNSLFQDEVYQYYCTEDSDMLGVIHTFKLPSRRSKNYSYVFLGDYDPSSEKGKNTHNYLTKLSQTQVELDNIFLLGNVGFELRSEKYMRGENFVRLSSSFLSQIPYTFSYGKEDSDFAGTYQFATKMFSNPLNDETNNIFFSQIIGPAYVINFNPTQILVKENPEDKLEMEKFIRSELEKATKMRQNCPWIIVVSHYPTYAQRTSSQDLAKELSIFESLFVEYRVDFYISAHTKSYERLVPRHKGKNLAFRQLQKEKDGFHYMDEVMGPLHFVSGSAGCADQPSSYEKDNNLAYMTSVRQSIGKLTIYNHTTALYQQIDTETEAVIDYVVVTKVGKYGLGPMKITIIIIFSLWCALVIFFSVMKKRKENNKSNQQKLLEGSNQRVPQ